MKKPTNGGHPPSTDVLPPKVLPPALATAERSKLDQALRGADVEMMVELQEIVDLLVQETDYPQRLDYAEIVRLAAALLPERERRIQAVLNQQ